MNDVDQQKGATNQSKLKSSPYGSDFFFSASTSMVLPKYLHSQAADFIYISDFDHFQLNLRNSGALKAAIAPSKGGSGKRDQSSDFRGHFERLQRLLKTTLEAKAELDDVRLQIADAKEQKIDLSSELETSLKAGTLTVDEMTFVKLSFERKHRLAVLLVKFDWVYKTYVTAFVYLREAKEDLARGLSQIQKKMVLHLAQNNILCVETVLQQLERARVIEKHDDNYDSIRADTDHMISDQWLGAPDKPWRKETL